MSLRDTVLTFLSSWGEMLQGHRSSLGFLNTQKVVSSIAWSVPKIAETNFQNS
jgi:hypothetical protein